MRDQRVLHKLRRGGWKTIVVWECQLQHRNAIDAAARAICDSVREGRQLSSND